MSLDVSSKRDGVSRDSERFVPCGHNVRVLRGDQSTSKYDHVPSAIAFLFAFSFVVNLTASTLSDDSLPPSGNQQRRACAHVSLILLGRAGRGTSIWDSAMAEEWKSR